MVPGTSPAQPGMHDVVMRQAWWTVRDSQTGLRNRDVERDYRPCRVQHRDQSTPTGLRDLRSARGGLPPIASPDSTKPVPQARNARLARETQGRRTGSTLSPAEGVTPGVIVASGSLARLLSGGTYAGIHATPPPA